MEYIHSHLFSVLLFSQDLQLGTLAVIIPIIPLALTVNKVVKHSFSSLLTKLYTDLSPLLTRTLSHFEHKIKALSSQLKIRDASML